MVIGFAGASLLALFAGYATGPTIRIPVGERDGLVFQGFSELESPGGFPLRWVAPGGGEIRMPQVGRPQGGVLQLQVWSSENQGSIPIGLTLPGQVRPRSESTGGKRSPWRSRAGA